jgi:hypothetical protein
MGVASRGEHPAAERAADKVRHQAVGGEAERRLAGAAGPEQDDGLAGTDREIDSRERVDRGAAVTERDALEREDGRREAASRAAISRSPGSRQKEAERRSQQGRHAGGDATEDVPTPN